jgi:hypothetical protein
MVTEPLLKVRSTGLARARTHHVCRACGEQYITKPGERLAAVFCVACLDAHDEPVTAEHAWELGGGD